MKAQSLKNKGNLKNQARAINQAIILPPDRSFADVAGLEKVKDDIKPVVKKETLEVKAIEPPKVVKYEPPTAVLEEKPKVTVPEKTAEKETVFSKYPEFEGKELSSGITWIDALWSDADFIRMYGTLSINPNERKDAVGKFVEDAEGMKDLYESMGSQDIGKNRERLMKILVSFKEE